MHKSLFSIRKGKIGRKIYVIVGCIGFFLTGLKVFGVDPAVWIFEKFRPPQEQLGFWNVGYNFTSHYLEYELGKQAGGSMVAFDKKGGGANGGGSECCYKPEYAGQLLAIRWVYFGGIYSEADRTTMHYEATLDLLPPRKPSEKVELAVRFYPGGLVAARYTEKTERGYFGNVSPDLVGSDWVQARGNPLPALLAVERKARDAGQQDMLEKRPAQYLPLLNSEIN